MPVDRTMSLLDVQSLLEQEEREHPARRRLADTDLAWLSDVNLLASQVTGMPMAIVIVLDSAKTHFIAVQGGELDAQDRASTLCDLVASAGEPVVIRDAATVPALAHYPAVQQGLRSYVGVPLAQDPASPVSFALCVADSAPHEQAGEVVEALQSLSRVAGRALAC